jgi:hypothetical protein
VINDSKSKLPPRAQALHDAAEEQRNVCCNWLLSMMTVSSEKTRTKDDLRAESIRRLKVSKSAFDFAWIDATKSLGPPSVRTAAAIKQENGKDASVLAVAATLTCGTNALRASYKRSSSSGLGVLGASRKNEALRCYGRLPSKTQDVFACDRLGIARQIEIGAVWRAHSRSSAAGRFRPLRDFVGLESIWKIQFSNSHNDGIGIFPLPRTRHLCV